MSAAKIQIFAWLYIRKLMFNSNEGAIVNTTEKEEWISFKAFLTEFLEKMKLPNYDLTGVIMTNKF